MKHLDLIKRNRALLIGIVAVAILLSIQAIRSLSRHGLLAGLNTEVVTKVALAAGLIVFLTAVRLLLRCPVCKHGLAGLNPTFCRKCQTDFLTGMTPVPRQRLDMFRFRYAEANRESSGSAIDAQMKFWFWASPLLIGPTVAIVTGDWQTLILFVPLLYIALVPIYFAMREKSRDLIRALYKFAPWVCPHCESSLPYTHVSACPICKTLLDPHQRS